MHLDFCSKPSPTGTATNPSSVSRNTKVRNDENAWMVHQRVRGALQVGCTAAGNLVAMLISRSCPSFLRWRHVFFCARNILESIANLLEEAQFAKAQIPQKSLG